MKKLSIKNFTEIKGYVNSRKIIQEKRLKEFLTQFKDCFPYLSDNIIESYYLYYHGINAVPLCPICNQNKKFKTFSKGYYTTCNSKECKDKFTYQQIKKSFNSKYGVENPSEIKEVQEKRKQTFIDKYGVANPYQSNEIKEKIKKTWIKNYGVDNPMKSKKVRDKAVLTLLKRYGIKNAYQMDKVLNKLKEKYGDNFGFGSEFFKRRSKETCLKKYGREFFLADKDLHKKITKTMEELYGGRGMGSDKIKKKIEKTNIEKYGNKIPSKTFKIKQKTKTTCLKKYNSTSHMHNIDILEKTLKNAHKWKQFKFPSSRIENVQGYEPQIIDKLLSNGYNEDDIIIANKDIENEIGKIFYKNKNKIHRYYPDIYIKSENKIIEVKSKYTYKRHLKINLLKKAACEEKGLNFEFSIYEPRKN